MHSRPKARHRNPLQRPPTHLSRLRLLVSRRPPPPRPAFRPILPKPTPGSELDGDGSQKTPLRGVVLPPPSASLASGHNSSAKSSRSRSVRRKQLARSRRVAVRPSAKGSLKTGALGLPSPTGTHSRQGTKPYDALFVASIGTDLSQQQNYDPVLVTLSCQPYMSIIPTHVVQRHDLPKLPLTPTQRSISYRTIFGYYEPKNNGYYTKLCIKSPKHGLQKSIQIALLIADFDIKDLTEELATCYRDHDLFLGSEFIDRLRRLTLTLDINGSVYGAVQSGSDSQGSPVHAESAEPQQIDLLSEEDETQEPAQQCGQVTNSTSTTHLSLKSTPQHLLSDGSYSRVASTSYSSEDIFSRNGYAPSNFTDITIPIDDNSPHGGMSQLAKSQEAGRSDWSSSSFEAADQASDTSIISTSSFNTLGTGYDPNIAVDMNQYQLEVFINTYQQMPMLYTPGATLYGNLFQGQMPASSAPDLSLTVTTSGFFHPKIISNNLAHVPANQNDMYATILPHDETME